MNIGKFLSRRDELLSLLSLTCLVFISLISVGSISFFISTFFSVLIVSFMISIIKIRKFNPDLVSSIKTRFYVLSYTLATTLLFILVLPYLVFHNSFVGIFYIQLLFILPILLVFCFSYYLYSGLINQMQLNYKGIIFKSLIFSAILMILNFIVVLILINNIYNSNSQRYYASYNAAFISLDERTQGKYSSNLPIFDEIKSYQEKFTEESDRQRQEFRKEDANRGLCITADCSKQIADKSYHLVTLTLNSVMTTGIVIQASNELSYITNKSYLQNFTSLDEYETHLLEGIDTYSYKIPSGTELNYEPDEDFTYKDFKDKIKELQSMNSGVSGIVSVFQTTSPLSNSLNYAVSHSKPFRELFFMIIKVYNFTNHVRRNSDLFLEIYKNKDMAEPKESKIIRYRLILTNLAQN